MQDPFPSATGGVFRGRNALLIATVLGSALALLTFSLQGSFWLSQDYGMLSLAHALHLEWRLSHPGTLPAPGLAGHPGILFYFASWLAVAVIAPPSGTMDFGRFTQIMANAEAIYFANQAIAIAIVTLSAYAFVRVARRVAPMWVVLAALGLWLGSSYQAVLTSTALSIETFSLLLNTLFLWVLLRIAAASRISVLDALMAGMIAAFGYLMKLPYLYVAFGLAAALMASIAIHRPGIFHSLRGATLICISFALCVVGVGLTVIGEQGFKDLLQFHLNVLLHSGHYGTGASGIAETSHVKAAWDSFAVYGSMAPWLAVMLAPACIFVAISGRLRGKADASVVIFAVGAGVAALLASLGVLKHFAEHYAAGVAPALCAVVIAAFLLIRQIQPGALRRFKLLLVVLVLLGLSLSFSYAISVKSRGAEQREMLLQDRSALEKLLHLQQGRTLFTYHVPMQEFGEGFILHYTGIPLLQQEYTAWRTARVSSYMRPTGSFKYVVLDKNYFRDAAAVRKAANLEPVGTVQLPPSTSDEIVQLNHILVVTKRGPFAQSPY